MVFSDILKFAWAHLLGITKNSSGLFVVLIGPDGSGKSTVAKLLTEEFKPLFGNVSYYHGRFGIIPDLRYFLNKIRSVVGLTMLPSSPKGENAIHDETPHGFFRSLVYISYYCIDYMLGYRYILKSRANAGSMVIFDRYYYDYFMQPQYTRVPRWLLRIPMSIIPTPDITLYLKGDPKQINIRKPELSTIEIQRQQVMIEELLPYTRSCKILETDGTIMDTNQQLQFLIVNILKGRYPDHEIYVC